MNIPGVKELADEVRQGQRDLLVVMLALGDLIAAKSASPLGQSTDRWQQKVADVRGRVAS